MSRPPTTDSLLGNCLAHPEADLLVELVLLAQGAIQFGTRSNSNALTECYAILHVNMQNLSLYLTLETVVMCCDTSRGCTQGDSTLPGSETFRNLLGSGFKTEMESVWCTARCQDCCPLLDERRRCICAEKKRELDQDLCGFVNPLAEHRRSKQTRRSSSLTDCKLDHHSLWEQYTLQAVF